MIPSVVWDRIPATTITSALGLPSKLLCSESPRLEWRRKRLQALRGTLAGTAILSQLIVIVQVTEKSKEAFSDRIFQGREPPFNVASQKEVVIRLAGKTSDTTSLSMERWGRRNIFPVFECSSQEIQRLVQRHGFLGNYGFPVFWRVGDGRYGDPDSWRGMKIPKQWLLNKTNSSEKILLLEADSVGPDDSISSIFSSNMATNADLDLYEATQGFYQLERLVEEDAPPHEVLKVLLVDSQAIVKSGGGHTQSVQKYVMSLGLADIIIDARDPLLFAIKEWLDQRPWDRLKTKRLWGRKKRRPVIVDSSSSTFFTSIKASLAPFGYDVMDIADAERMYGSPKDIPILVNEDTSLATIHTVRKLLERKITISDNVCAFCGEKLGLVELDSGQESPIVTICSSDVYDGLFRIVRSLAVQGYSKVEIQDQVDTHKFVVRNSAEKQLGFPTL
eukprot:CAMPEP_0194220212 /NCGR_PEP_ID=MMETSP0156-20130528/27750_1 /TAXON_ID=33649 /ORGANISM="Thalassionema nitzschioides, Strain L26-B" /LENGTH=446 /DNA_ID=CAMNT_0038950155 /DNA_START=288 /DNA_END=1628 /DNA_ORIENTATION=+